MTDGKGSGDEQRDELLSASLDEELGDEERAELARIRQRAEDDTAERERAFREVDDGLRALAREPVDEARLAASFEKLDSRLAGRESSGEPNGSAGLGFRIGRLAIGAAAAAAVVFYLLLPSLEPVVEGTDSLADSGVVGSEMDDLALEDMVFAIGYGDENAEIGMIMGEDFEVIEQLELLDYLLAVDGEERG